MFYIWITYLKKYSGLGPKDTVGIIIDSDTLDYMNESGYLGYITEGVKFNLEISLSERPRNLSEGFSERYNYTHFTQLTKHEINLHLDIDCLVIRSIVALFPSEGKNKNSIFVAPEGKMTESNYGGFLLEADKKAETMPGFSAGFYAWTHPVDGEGGIKDFFKSVSKGVLTEADTPLYTVDQPFYNYELYLYLTGTKLGMEVYMMDPKLIAVNPLFSDSKLADAFFVNFCGEPGVEECHFYKMLSFMCIDFSTSAVVEPKPMNNSSLVMDTSSYIMEPYHLLSYDSRKTDGTLPIVQIGKKCSIAVNCTFTLSNHLMDRFSTSISTNNLFTHSQGNPSSYSKGDIIIKNDVWIGTNVTILDGLTVGNGAVIAAGSVVVKDVPPYAVIGGNPAKIIRYRFSQDIIDDLERIDFWDLSIEEIKQFDIHTKDVKYLIQKIKDYKYSIFEKGLTQQHPHHSHPR